jgi:DNA polymerase III alpha subunit
VRLGMRMVKGLANTHAATIVAARAERPFLSVDDLWRRAGVPAASLVQLAEADAFRPALAARRSVSPTEASSKVASVGNSPSRGCSIASLNEKASP